MIDGFVLDLVPSPVKIQIWMTSSVIDSHIEGKWREVLSCARACNRI